MMLTDEGSGARGMGDELAQLAETLVREGNIVLERHLPSMRSSSCVRMADFLSPWIHHWMIPG